MLCLSRILVNQKMLRNRQFWMSPRLLPLMTPEPSHRLIEESPLRLVRARGHQ